MGWWANGCWCADEQRPHEEWVMIAAADADGCRGNDEAGGRPCAIGMSAVWQPCMELYTRPHVVRLFYERSIFHAWISLSTVTTHHLYAKANPPFMIAPDCCCPLLLQ